MPRDKLIHMANQIAAFFASQPAAGAAEGVAQHLNDFWDPRMRRELAAILAEEPGATALAPLVRAAAPMIRVPA